MGILDNAEQVKSTFEVDPKFINVFGKDMVTGTFAIDPQLIADAEAWRKYMNAPATTAVDPDYADHWHSEDLPTEPGTYLAAFLYDGKVISVDGHNNLVEYIVHIKGEAPFMDISMWQIGQEYADTNVTPEQIKARINAGYTRIK